MKKSIIIILQIITLLLMVSDHFLVTLYYYVSSSVLLWGYNIGALLVDVVLYITIGLQILIIVLLIEQEVK